MVAVLIFITACGGGDEPVAPAPTNINTAVISKCLVLFGAEDTFKSTSGSTTITTNYFYSKGYSCTETCVAGSCTTSLFEFTPIKKPCTALEKITNPTCF